MGSAAQLLAAMFGILKPNSKEPTPTPEDVTPPPPRSMAPVPPGHYRNREALLDFAKHWAQEQGYAIVISRSRSNRLWLKCDRGGKYENRRHITEEQRKRKRGDSRLMGCPFMVMAVLKDDIWKLKTEVETHNHEASEDLTAHPSLRKMTKEQMNHLEQMTENGSTPAEIMDALKVQWPNINIVKRDVYNARKKYKENKRNGVAASPPAEEDQHWEDPNGVVPGPTATGKWVWAEEGEELVSKGKKKRRKVFMPNPPSMLDPELQNPTPPPRRQSQHYADNALSSTMGFQDFASSYQDQSSSLSLQHHQASQAPHDRSNSAPNPLQQLQDFPADQAEGSFPTSSSMDHNNFFSQQHHQQQRNSFPSITAPYSQPSQPAESAVMIPSQPPLTRSASAAAAATTQANGGGSELTPSPAGQAALPPSQKPNGQVLMSRIERMEKEQHEQKDMLAQILGAVQKHATDV